MNLIFSDNIEEKKIQSNVELQVLKIIGFLYPK